MKISKEARRKARQMFRASLVDGRMDQAHVAKLTDLVIQVKPRNYQQTLHEYARLIRLEAAKHHAIIQSPAPLVANEAEDILKKIHTSFGPDVTTEFQVCPDLLGGLRVQVGSDVWDGSIRHRLEALTKQL